MIYVLRGSIMLLLSFSGKFRKKCSGLKQRNEVNLFLLLFVPRFQEFKPIRLEVPNRSIILCLASFAKSCKSMTYGKCNRSQQPSGASPPLFQVLPLSLT
ncbi:hypothetical protein M378DRAFT_662743 [Amanita muscaria Koide BX008]|uniref:Uncharacterized protein n=1 Tax=Amanita muscaria (strain Koide BX008) TaxID=946122 RepID=A0A0C2X421_AMAMK|nr:hypothetical protein M378DRAFT_662743 [Amanita muscaria Koide BX008]